MRREYFEELKKNLADPPIFNLPKLGAPYLADTVARQYALGAVLLQEQKLEEKSPGRRIREGSPLAIGQRH